jgi:hypothetical protein
LRVLSDWINAVIDGRQIVALGLIDERYATIQTEANGGGAIGPTRPVKRTSA